MKVNEISETMDKREIEITGATLLSIEEAKKYLSPEDRQYENWWWLRSPGNDSCNAAYVRDDGDISHYGDYVGDSDGCVRPALKIKNLKSSGMSIGDVFELNDDILNLRYEFKIISENLAWIYKQEIGMRAFNFTNENKCSNDYETSGIKNCVDLWYSRLVWGDSDHLEEVERWECVSEAYHLLCDWLSGKDPEPGAIEDAIGYLGQALE